MDDKLVPLYDDKNFSALMFEHKGLFYFEDVAKWGIRAQEEVDRIIKVIEGLEADILHQGKELERENTVHAQKPFFSRIFTKNENGRAIGQLIQKLRDNKKNLSEMVSHLEEAIAFSPNSLEEQVNLAQELHHRKIELQAKQIEVAVTKEIRAGAHQKGVHTVVNENSFGAYDAKRVPAQRRQIRYTKEALLQPRENVKAMIERQLAQLDRDILLAEKFKK
ncbi:MAG: hypothetical protein H7Y59_05590 [Anaerolineales bacterium]|nr:hypothetical protein [Anaerolineales bacterium]